MYPITPGNAQRTAELAANWIDRVNKVVGSKESVEAVKAILRHAAFEAAGRTGDAIPKAAGTTAAAQVGSALGNIFSELVILVARALYISLEPLIDFTIAISKGSADLLVALKSVFYVSLIFYVGLAIFNPTQFSAINAAVVAAYVALRTKVNGVVAKMQAFRKRNLAVNNLLNCGCRMCMTRWNDTHNTVDESQHKPKRARANECDCRKCMVAWNAAFNERDACTNPDYQIKFASPEEEARFMANLYKGAPRYADDPAAHARFVDVTVAGRVQKEQAAMPTFKQVNITDPVDAAKWAADMRAEIEAVERLAGVRTTVAPLLAAANPNLDQTSEERCARLLDMLLPYLKSSDAIMHPESKRRVKAIVRRTKNAVRRVRFALSDNDKAALSTTIAAVEDDARVLGFYVRPSAATTTTAAPIVQPTAEPTTTTATAAAESKAAPPFIQMYVQEMNRLHNGFENRRIELGRKVTMMYSQVQDTTLGPDAYARMQHFQQGIAQTRIGDAASVETDLSKLERDVAEWIATLQAQPMIVVMQPADTTTDAPAKPASIEIRVCSLLKKLLPRASKPETKQAAEDFMRQAGVILGMADRTEAAVQLDILEAFVERFCTKQD